MEWFTRRRRTKSVGKRQKGWTEARLRTWTEFSLRSATCVGKYDRSPVAFALANAVLTRLGRLAGARREDMSVMVK